MALVVSHGRHGISFHIDYQLFFFLLFFSEKVLSMSLQEDGGSLVSLFYLYLMYSFSIAWILA